MAKIIWSPGDVFVLDSGLDQTYGLVLESSGQPNNGVALLAKIENREEISFKKGPIPDRAIPHDPIRLTHTLMKAFSAVTTAMELH